MSKAAPLNFFIEDFVKYFYIPSRVSLISSYLPSHCNTSTTSPCNISGYDNTHIPLILLGYTPISRDVIKMCNLPLDLTNLCVILPGVVLWVGLNTWSLGYLQRV